MDKQLFQDAGRYVLAWAKRHKVAAGIIVVLFVFLLWPKSTPKLRGVEAKADTTAGTAASANPSRAASSSTQPASTQPVTAQRAGDLPLYYPDVDGADPNWSLPAELKAGDLQGLARQVDKLARDMPATAQLEQQCNEALGQIFTGQSITLFWSRLMGSGFHDANLPLDWYETVKERNSVLGNLAAMGEAFTNQMVQAAIAMRLVSVEVRIIGGKVLVGDMLFVKASQAYIDQRKPYFERLLPLLQSVTKRMQQEFRSELNQSRPQG